MTIAPATVDPDGSPAPQRPRRLWISVRWKMLVAFLLAFTVVLAVMWVWIYSFTTTTTQNRLVTEMRLTSQTVAADLDRAAFLDYLERIREQGPGKVTDALGQPHVQQMLADLALHRESVEGLGLVSYYRDAEGVIRIGTLVGYVPDDQLGSFAGLPADEVTTDEVVSYMQRGLAGTVDQPAYQGAFGLWITAYTPITDSTGAVIGGLLYDVPLTYVDAVQSELRSRLIPIMIASYVVMALLVVGLATSLTRPLKRLNVATRRVADGEYDLDVNSLVPRWLPDEMSTLATSFTTMAEKVAARERSLTQEVRKLRVEIDEVRRAKSVADITETEFFAELVEKAARERLRSRGITD